MKKKIDSTVKPGGQEERPAWFPAKSLVPYRVLPIMSIWVNTSSSLPSLLGWPAERIKNTWCLLLTQRACQHSGEAVWTSSVKCTRLDISGVGVSVSVCGQWTDRPYLVHTTHASHCDESAGICANVWMFLKFGASDPRRLPQFIKLYNDQEHISLSCELWVYGFASFTGV